MSGEISDLNDVQLDAINQMNVMDQKMNSMI